MFSERCGEISRDRIGRLCQSLGCIASDHMSLFAKIASLMDSRCAVSPCLVDIAYRLKHFIFDLNSLFGFFKDIGRLCNNEADRISDHSGGIALGDHDIPVLSDMTHFVAGDILRRQHAQYARE